MENEEKFDLEGKDFILAGYGRHGAFKNNGSVDVKSSVIFHRGYNTVDKIGLYSGEGSDG